NYVDRKGGAPVAIYSQTVDEQFYPYIRPQETGTKSDVRYWRQIDLGKRGIEIVADAPFSASALHYTQESLDEGLTKKQAHSQEEKPDTNVWLCIDKAQCGLGGIDSWGAHPLPKYTLPYADRTFSFKITPIK
ncbi:MAG: beta-galactosidase, partial [Muribaculaceae bacterium]|nr:beta-galactosidase [Muribaculaceae bacterium]